MPPIAEAIYRVLSCSNRPLSAKEIKEASNNNHFFLYDICTKSIDNAIYREWQKDNYVFYKVDDYTRPQKYRVDDKYYKPNGRIVGPES